MMMRRLIVLQVAAGGLALLLVGLLLGRLLLTPAQGTLLLLASGRTGSQVTAGPLQLHSAEGWLSLRQPGTVTVPKAPATATLAQVDVPAASYDGVRWGGAYLPIRFSVDKSQLMTVLLGVENERPVESEAYAGSEGVSLGLNELSGHMRSLPAFSLTDQFGRPYSNANVAGHDVIVAAFHTNCHETCPLYTGLFLELRKRLPPSVLLLEVTNDPVTDTPDVLRQYAGRFGASWTFLTGSPAALTDFWKPFDEELDTGGGNSHRSELALVDAHGFIRSYYLGTPDVGGTLPNSLASYLDPIGFGKLYTHGDGWGAAQIIDTLNQIGGTANGSSPGQGPARDFTLSSLDGGRVSLSALRGKPVLINFWASWCVPCRQEMPMIERVSRRYRTVVVLLVNERDSPSAARSFLDSIGLHGIDVPLDEDGKVGDLYGVTGLPTSFFVRSDGSLQGGYIGQMNESILTGHLGAITGSRPP